MLAVARRTATPEQRKRLPSTQAGKRAAATGATTMSEYQYYEFQAIDRPLTAKEMATLRGYSSRATITPTRFVNDYSCGSFKGNASEWMEKYFDAFLYLANWGTHEFMLRASRRGCCRWKKRSSTAWATRRLRGPRATTSSWSFAPKTKRAASGSTRRTASPMG